MRLDLSQHMRMEQRMTLAPRMIQSMEILQLPVMALEERIRQEVEQNPALELGASTTETTTTDLAADEEMQRPAEIERDERRQDGPSDQEVEVFEKLAEEFNDGYVPGHQGSRLAGIELSNKKHDAMQNMA